MLIDLEAVSFGFENGSILEDISVKINDKDRIGLIGNNGAGKTTLLRLIVGEYTADSGKISKKGNLSIGYLRQNEGLDNENKVMDEMLEVFSETRALLKKMEALSSEMALEEHSSNTYKRLADEYDRAEKAVTAKDGYNLEVRIKTVLNGMGFTDCYDRIISTLSGGEKTRLAISKLLLLEPELLILDEPTNHLDFKTLAWLEGYLAGYKNALLTVSHDRYFLDKAVSRIWELEDKEIYSYSGNYSQYKITKRELLSYRMNEYEKQSNMIASMLDYAQRNIARATTSKSAKSRLHRLENIEVLKKPRTYTKPPRFYFDFAKESGKSVISVKDMTLAVGSRRLFEDLNFSVLRREKVAILGANGTGKSTLIRALKDNKDSSISYGVDVRVGYYDQENLNLNFENTVLEELWYRHPTESQTTMRAILGGLLLGAEDIYKKISSLSGGERAKLGFALVMAEHANTLLLDEPTNHLDLMTREALEEALCEYSGTVIFVSHDRYFLDKLASRILEADSGKLTSYVGNFTEYSEQKRLEALEIAAKEEEKTLPSSEKKAYRSARDRSREVARKQALSKLEKEISDFEELIARLEKELLLPENLGDYKKYNALSQDIEKHKTELSVLYDRWLELNE